MSAKAVDDRLIDEPASRARAEGPQPTGEGELSRQPTEPVVMTPWAVA